MPEDRPWYRDPRVVIARRDVRSLSREKTIVLALLIQLFVAGFSSFLVVGLTSLYDPGAVAAGEVEMAVTGDAQDELLEAAREHQGADTVGYENPDEARLAFQQRRVDALLNARYVAAPDGGQEISVTARIPEGSIRSTLIVVNVRQVLNTLERQERFERTDSLERDPVPLPEEVDASPYFGFTYTVLIPLLLFLPAFISGSVAVDTITEEMERGTLELLRVAPVSLLDIVDGKALGMVLLAPAQSLLWILLLELFNNISVANPLVILVFVTAVATLVVTIGVMLGVATGKRRPAQLLYSVLTLVVFGFAVVLPEHPATTVAKLSVDSPTLLTYAHVGGAVVLAAAAYAVARRYVGGVDASAF